ncbi:MAG: hypothetical protein DHS20C16_05510 [Phycisphaerae bacterium]|nr:MAG: hypothetical protein DHS20C16_05510 [Phycisphaerae bacterium]
MFHSSRFASVSTASYFAAACCVAMSTLSAVADVTPELYWQVFGTAERISIDGSGRETLFSRVTGGQGMDVSTELGMMYWTDESTSQVMRADLDGVGHEVILTETGRVRDVVIDAAAGHIYWSNIDLDKIQRAELDGSNPIDVVTDIGFVNNMHLDSSNGHLYFSDSETDTVRRADLDGSNHVNLLTSFGPGVGDTRGVDVDLTRGHLYYSDIRRNGIFRTDLDGNNEVLFAAGMSRVFDLQILPETDEIFWIDNETMNMYRSPLEVANPTIIESNVQALSIALTPEPGTLFVFGIGAIVIGTARRSRRRF